MNNQKQKVEGRGRLSTTGKTTQNQLNCQAKHTLNSTQIRCYEICPLENYGHVFAAFNSLGPDCNWPQMSQGWDLEKEETKYTHKPTGFAFAWKQWMSDV